MTCTLVTCYYPVKSKYPSEQYLRWATDFLRLDASIVLFTLPELAGLFKEIRSKVKPVETHFAFHIVTMRFEDLDAWAYKTEWEKHHVMDPEKDAHSPELYAIWAQKAFFVRRAIDLNIFGTNYFFWCDIGCFRNGLDPVIQTSFPSVRHLPADRILMSSVGPSLPGDNDARADGIRGDFLRVNRIVGGLWGGGATGCIRWFHAYKDMLERYFAASRFAGKDQSVMLSAYLENRNLAHIVRCTEPSINIWFYLTYLCSNKDVHYELDNTYIEPSVNVSVSLLGGLGNQLFQIATAYAYASRIGGRLQLLREKRVPDGRPMYWSSVLDRFTPNLVDRLPNMSIWRERGPTVYTEIPICEKNGLFLEGYFQSSKYFSEYTQDIKRLFAPSREQLDTIQSKYDFLLSEKKRIIVVHARRTDYLKNEHNIQYHGPLGIGYYKDAIEKAMTTVTDPYFLLCSDDPLFWLEVIPHISALQTYPFFILMEDEITTLALLQQFHYFIIANSTFSWWFSWLADSAFVYAPKQWFGPKGPSAYDDIYESSWIRI